MAGSTYNDEYWEQCFEIWYAAGCPQSLSRLRDLLPEVEGVRPHTSTISDEREKRMWFERADEMNAKAALVRQEKLILQKAEMLERQAESAKELQQMAMDKLRIDGFDTSSSAVQAFIRAAEMERESRGMGDMMVKLAKLSDDDLMEEAKKLLERNAEAVDAEVITTDEEVEVERMEND